MKLLAALIFVMSFLHIYSSLSNLFSFGWDSASLALSLVCVINISQAVQVFRRKQVFVTLAFWCNLLCLFWIIYTYYDLFQVISPLSTSEIPYLIASLCLALGIWVNARSKKKKIDMPDVFQ